ncbi:MAG: lytic transglycosylase domain-containing protein [Candidatus Eremiobacteraeota bacterium]|nr:lytic transglycosylase domain-containing protein [Candidatus Eremiobacteraeota bacterium]
MKESFYRRLCLRAAIVIWFAMLCACTSATSEDFDRHPLSTPRIETLVNTALSWHGGLTPLYTQTVAGVALLHDGAPFKHENLAVARSIERSNERLSSVDALHLADLALNAAKAHALNPEFFCAALLQESAFDPEAISSAGAVGIAQFTLDTAAGAGINPFDPGEAIEGAAALLAQYVRQYEGRYDDPYAAALAAYNAGPGAVAAYHGVPPYRETREYISDIYERWARILKDEAWRR